MPDNLTTVTSTLARSCPNTSSCISQVHCWRLSSRIFSGAMATLLSDCHPLFHQSSNQNDGRIQSTMTTQCQSLGDSQAASLQCRLNADMRLSGLCPDDCR